MFFSTRKPASFLSALLALVLLVTTFANILLLPPIPKAQADISTGLISHYTFDNTANDSAGTNHGALVGGPTYTTGKVNQALNFDGTSTHVALGDPVSLRITGNVTIAAWIKADNFAGDNRFVYASGSVGGSYYMLWVDSAGVLRFSNDGVGGGMNGSTLQTGQWYHIVAVSDSSTGESYLYLNGALNASKAMTIPAAVGEKRIGNRFEGTNLDWFDGILDDVRIYNRALSPSDVQELYTDNSTLLNVP